jgi:hypothetical protein
VVPACGQGAEFCGQFFEAGLGLTAEGRLQNSAHLSLCGMPVPGSAALETHNQCLVEIANA